MYSPKIKEDHVRQLYQLKQVEKKPMTRLVAEALDLYLQLKQSNKEVPNENK